MNDVKPGLVDVHQGKARAHHDRRSSMPRPAAIPFVRRLSRAQVAVQEQDLASEASCRGGASANVCSGLWVMHSNVTISCLSDPLAQGLRPSPHRRPESSGLRDFPQFEPHPAASRTTWPRPRNARGRGLRAGGGYAQFISDLPRPVSRTIRGASPRSRSRCP